MDILLFFIGVFCLFRRHYAVLFTIIVVLASSYLQINIDDKYHNILFSHNVSDTGILLYILFLFTIAFSRGFYTKGKIQKVTSAFLLFIVINGMYDYLICGTLLGDVVRYIRHWTFLSVVYILPYLKAEWIIKTFRYLYYVTLLSCCLILFQRFTGLTIIEMRFDIGAGGVVRGSKPPSYCIYFGILCLINFWNVSKFRQCVEAIIFLSPIILNLKMTYAVTVFLAVALYIIMGSNISTIKKIGISVFAVISVIFFFAINETFATRFTEMVQQTKSFSFSDIDNREGNFTYRLAHTAERFEYITSSPQMFIRGLGYVSESHYRGHQFSIGTWNDETRSVAQLDTGDIAWSILFIRLGVIGTLFFIYYYLFIWTIFKKKSTNNKYNMYASVALLVYLCFTSFGNTLICSPDFFFVNLMFLSPQLLDYKKDYKYLLNKKMLINKN